MSNAMNQEDINYFIDGLKTVIRNSWHSQEDFAKGVTSKVNISNILRKKTGTSYNMRVDLANRAGMTIDEVIALGRKVSNPKPIQESSIENTQINLQGGSLNEITNTINELTINFNNDTTYFIQNMCGIVNSIVSERDKLITLLAKEHSVLNSFPIAMQVINKDMKVVYTNKLSVETFQITVNDDCTVETRAIYSELALAVNTVLTTNNIIRKFITYENNNYVLEAYPIRNNSWILSHVSILIFFADPWIELFKTFFTQTR